MATGEDLDLDVPEGLVFTTLDIAKHAQAVADMWNASDANWPGTWTAGVPETAESVTRSYQRQEPIETFLCLDGNVVGGYCKVMPDLDEPGVDYVALVNVPPSHQKKGIARRLLQRATRLAVERSSNRLDLHTWTANLNAVPLYKKIGFMWMPDTDIHMLNFMPAILRLDAAQDFFATRDWYRVFRRPLDQVPDEERWEGMKVFTYGFADSPDAPADADPALLVRIDRESRAICAVETPDYAVGATAARLDPPKGGEVTLTWTVTNRGPEPLPLTVVANGTTELLIDHRASATVTPGATEQLTATCRIAPDAKDVKPDKPVPAVKSVLLLGDQVVELSTGLRPRPAMEISTHPRRITLAPGTSRKVQVRLRNRLEERADVDLRATAAEGLKLSWASRSLSADGEGWCGADLEITAPHRDTGSYSLDLSATVSSGGATLRVEPDPRSVFVLAPATVLAARSKDSLRIENDHFCAVLLERGAVLSFQRPDGSGAWGSSVAYAGPPFGPTEFSTLDYDLSWVATQNGIEATAVGRSKRWPGFVVRRRIRFGAGPVVEAAYEVENGESDPRPVQVSHGFYRGGEGRGVLPLAAGLTAGQAMEHFPGTDDNESKKPARYGEEWWAVETSAGDVAGVVWSGATEEVGSAGMAILTPKQELGPQQRLTIDPLWVWCGPGSWQTIRDLWRRRRGIVEPLDAEPEEPARPLAARVEPAPWLVTGGSGVTTLVVEHANTWPVGGDAELVAPDGWNLDHSKISLADTTWQRPARVEVVATPPAVPAAGLVRVKVRGHELDAELEVPVLSIGNGGASVERSEERGQELWTIGAGLSQVAVAPAHGGATVSWKVDGVEQLASDWPEATAIGWLLPWHGGIAPVLMAGDNSFPGYLWRESFSAEAVEEKDSRGLLWKGVKVSAESSHEETKGIGVDSITMALPGAPVLKHVIRVRNGSGAMQVPLAGAFAWCAPGGQRAGTRARAENLSLNPSGRYGFNTTGTWAAAENAQSGATVLMCSRYELTSVKLGTDGAHVASLRRPELEPGGQFGATSYLVAAPSLEAALPWRALTDLD